MKKLATQNDHSYGQILESTTIVGGSQVINILIGIIRTKFLAVVLGPSGIGLLGMYTAITTTIGAMTNMGIGTSGVRQIAEASGTGDSQKISRTIVTIRRFSLFFGFLGMILTIIFCKPISILTFGNVDYSWPIALLSFIIFLNAVSGGQIAIIQGMRRIIDLASSSVLGSLLGTMISIPIIFFLKNDGLVAFLIIISFMSTLASWWYARKIPVANIILEWRDSLQEAKGLLSLGLVFMATALMTAAVMYLIQIMVVRQLGIDSVGLYQAAITLSNLYIGGILGAMGMDFFPRLTAVASDNVACNRMVNEQTEVGLLVAVPGILATLTFAPMIIQIFYSSSFIPAYEVLRWQICGMFLRVISWPMGWVLAAKVKKTITIWTELTANIVHLSLVWLGMKFFGLEGVGMALFALYIFYTIMILAVMSRLTNFRWSSNNIRLILLATFSVSVIFLISQLTSQYTTLVWGTLLTLFFTFYSIVALYRLVGLEWVVESCKKLKSLFEG